MATQYPVIGLSTRFDLHYVGREENRPLDLTKPRNFVFGYHTALLTHPEIVNPYIWDHQPRQVLNPGFVVLSYETTRPIILLDARYIDVSSLNVFDIHKEIDGVMYVSAKDGSINVYLYAPAKVLIPCICDEKDERVTYSVADYMGYECTRRNDNQLPSSWFDDNTDYIRAFTKRQGRLIAEENQCQLVMA